MKRSKFGVIILFVVLMCLFCICSVWAQSMVPRYRLYNPNNFHHHYTTDPNEYQHLGSIGWVQEGVACYLYNEMVTIESVNAVPYYRLYNPNSFEHHWTTDANEYNVLGTIGWHQEGADGFVFASQVSGSEPLYRLYNPNNGLHLWTMDANEKNVLIGSGFVDEGNACYVFPIVGTIEGVVEGTIILAVVNDEIEVSEDTSGRMPDVDKNGDGNNESFSFALTGIPIDSDVRIFLVENGGIFPLYFDSDGDGKPDTNVFSLSSGTVVSLGLVDTTVEGQDGRAIPENNPADTPNVLPKTEDTDIPESLNQPNTSGLTLDQLNSAGLDALKDAWVLRAKTYFEDAKNLAGSSISNDADTARFFYALTRVAALGFDSYSDRISSNGLNALGDILDGFGSPADDTKRSNFEAISFPDPLPSNSPSGNELQSFLNAVVRPELEGAINNLDKVSETFNTKWTEPIDDEIVESDYGDVLFFKALFKGALASVNAQSAYNLDADIDDTVNNDKTIEQFLNDEPDFLTLSGAPNNDLNFSKMNFDAGLEDLDKAILWMDAEADSQDDDFINLADTTAEEINQARSDITDAKNSLDGPTMVNDNKDPNDGFELDMSVFFAGLDFRNPNLLPTFSGNDPVGLFPDATFRGVFGEGIDLNEDIDPADGNADILEKWPF